jgi:predicted ATP-dependent endonuclease of OLD family
MIEVRQPEDLASIVFCYDINNEPRQIAPDADELQGKQLRTLLAHMGQEHKLTFFCDRPVLLEGPSDLIMCTGIDRSLDLYLEAAGAQLLPVIGKGQFPVVSKLMRLIGKSPIIVADTDAIADNLDLVNSYAIVASANAAATDKGFRNVGDLASSVYRDFANS